MQQSHNTFAIASLLYESFLYGRLRKRFTAPNLQTLSGVYELAIAISHKIIREIV
ncbi:hypothetical protein [Nostoc sp.]|uniref:hypothetical protein n=1 Tax=Nostoc sp. TaxID=1180 RepID=UPI002FF76459